MWMVECNDHCKELKTSIDSIFGRKLRPLMPKAPISSNSTMCGKLSTIPPTPSCGIHNSNNNILTWNQPSSGLSDYGVKKELHTLPLVSSRWNPTPEQLQALEEMYRRGIRTPSAEQIKQIAVKLRRFGKIEGKNVFYWFQNHKARERQKKRRQLELIGAGKNLHFVESQERKQTGLSRRYMQTEHTKKLLSPSDCGTPSQGSVSMHRAVVSECKTVGRTQLEQRELHLQQQQQKTIAKNDDICWQLDLSSCMSSNSSIIAQKNSGQENEKPLGALNLSISLASKNDDFKNFEQTGIQENDQTLQLFPIKNNDHNINVISGVEEDNYTSVSRTETKFRTNEFFEFLPTKN